MVFWGRLYMVGPGGYELRLSLGSEMHELEELSMGHLMLPCSRFDEHCHQTDESMSFLVGNYFEATTRASSPQGLASTDRTPINSYSHTPTAAAPVAFPNTLKARPEHFQVVDSDDEWEAPDNFWMGKRSSTGRLL